MKQNCKNILIFVIFSYAFELCTSSGIIPILKSKNPSSIPQFVGPIDATPNNDSYLSLTSYFPDTVNSSLSSGKQAIITLPKNLLSKISSGVWILVHDIPNTFNFAYAAYDWQGKSLSFNGVATGGVLSDSFSGSYVGTMAVQFRSNIPAWENIAGLSSSNVSALFIMNRPTLLLPKPINSSSPGWGVPSGWSLPVGSALQTWVTGNIKQANQITQITSAVPLGLSQLKDDLQIMLLSTWSDKRLYVGGNGAIICSLDGSAEYINKGNLNEGVYVVLSNQLPLTNGAQVSGITYSVFDRSGKLLGSGNISSYGTIQLAPNTTAGNVGFADTMFLFNSAFSTNYSVGGNVYPLAVNTGSNPQIFLLQYGSVTSINQSSVNNSKNKQVSKKITQLQKNITNGLNSLLVTDPLYNAINYQKTWYSSIYSSIYTPIMAAYMPGVTAPSANSVKLCVDYNKLLIAQLEDLNQYLLSQIQS